MILPDVRIKELIAKGNFSVEPLGENCIQPASVDCTLGQDWSILDGKSNDVVELDEPQSYTGVSSDSWILEPGDFVLATTQEYFKFGSNVTAFVEGRSSIGRLGLFVENAGWIDPGFEGQITLELFNASHRPIRLYAGRRICQLVICELDTHAENPYRGKYQGQVGAVGTRINQDAETNSTNDRTSELAEWATILHETYFDNVDHWATLGARDPGLLRMHKRNPEEAKKVIFSRLCQMKPDKYGYHQ